MSTPRREFLKGAAASALGAAGAQANQAAASLPKVKLGEHQVTRLILGANPFYGFSHFNKLFSDHMVEWSTPNNVVKTLRACEQNGINTWQFSYAGRGLSDIERHRAEGGKLQWILLSGRKIEEDLTLIPPIAKQKPIGIVHHGGTTDRRWRNGEQAKIREFLKRVRDTGVLVGLSTHNPAVLAAVEEQNWDVDFYMTCIYQMTRTNEDIVKLLGQRPLGEVFLPEDPPRMFEMIRKTRKPCLAYKILAAGRVTDSPRQIDRAFQVAFDNLKAGDAIIVGMYPRYSDQVKENSDRVRKILGS